MTRELTPALLDQLVDVAETSIRVALVERRCWRPDAAGYPSTLRAPGAAFVTLHRDDALLGCVGTLRAAKPLVVTVADRAVAAAFSDPRFPGIALADYVAMDVTVSVLSPLEELWAWSYDELLTSVVAGEDGLLVQAGHRSATLLPAVWEQIPEPADLVGALWRKAGLAPRAWLPGTRVWRYRAQQVHRRAAHRGGPGRCQLAAPS